MLTWEELQNQYPDKWLILESPAMDPTAGNQQLYTILDITNQELKENKRIVLTDEIEFPIVEFDPTLFQEDLTIISSVHPENPCLSYHILQTLFLSKWHTVV